MYRRIIGVAVALAVTGFLAVGCGGGGEDEATASVTKAQFVKSTDAVCEKNHKQREAEFAALDKQLESEGQEPESSAGIETRLTDVVIPSMERQLEELEAVDVPEDSEAKMTKMLQTYSKGIEKLKEEMLDALNGSFELALFAEEAETVGLNCKA